MFEFIMSVLILGLSIVVISLAFVSLLQEIAIEKYKNAENNEADSEEIEDVWEWFFSRN